MHPLEAPPFILTNSSSPMITPTYDGSKQAVHPDILVFPKKFRGFKYLLCYDPFPNGDPSKENPSIYVSNEKDKGYTNSIEGELIPNPISGVPAKGWFNSDSDFIFWRDKIWLYWRQGRIADNYRQLMVRRSADLIHWDEAKVLWAYEGAATRYCSPAFVPEDNEIHAWFVNASDYTLHLFEMRNGETPIHVTQCNFTLPLKRRLWHIDVAKLSNGEYWALACDREGDLWFARSIDKINWIVHYPPVLKPKKSSWDCGRIHRATFAVYEGKIMVWYGACDKSSTWHCGYTETNVKGLDIHVKSGNVLEIAVK